MEIEKRIDELKKPDVIEKDQKAEKILKQLGFKPGQFFTWSEVEERWSKTAIDESFEARSTFFDFIATSNIVQNYFRFAPEDELMEIKEIQGRK